MTSDNLRKITVNFQQSHLRLVVAVVVVVVVVRSRRGDSGEVPRVFLAQIIAHDTRREEIILEKRKKKSETNEFSFH